MTDEFRSATDAGNQRGVRLALVSSAAVFILMLAILAAIQIVAMLEQGRTLNGLLLALAALLVLFFAGRVVAMNWHALHRAAQPPGIVPDGSDQTGIWGVGGPSMREPGSTGVWPARRVDRRYEDSGR